MKVEGPTGLSHLGDSHEQEPAEGVFASDLPNDTTLWPEPTNEAFDQEPGYFSDLAPQRYRVPLELEQAAAVLETINQGILIVGRDGECLYANLAAARELGVNRENLLRKNIHAAVHPQPHPEGSCLFTTPFIDALARLDRPDRWRSARRGYLPVMMSVEPLVRDGEVTNIVVVFNDASEQFDREIERARAKAEREQVIQHLRELNDQKTDFVFTVSHELRTPLTSVLGYLELALESEAVTGEDREYIEIALKNADRLLAQVEALLAVSRIESGRVETRIDHVEVKDLIAVVTEAMQPQATKRGVNLNVEVEPDLVMEADGTQIERVLLNLLSNAIKFTPTGGEVWLSASNAGNYVQFRIEDNGLGIPEKDQPHLFGKFFRAANAQEQAIPGTGLGLAIVKAIVEAHHGRIRLASEEERGTVVAFTIPREAVGLSGS